MCVASVWLESYLARDGPPVCVSPLPDARVEFSPRSTAFFPPVSPHASTARLHSHSSPLSLPCSLCLSHSCMQHRCQGCACLPTLPVGVLHHPLLPTSTAVMEKKKRPGRESEMEIERGHLRAALSSVPSAWLTVQAG